MLSSAGFHVRILFWSELFWPHIGGAEIFGRDLILALAARGHHFRVVTSHADGQLPDEEMMEGVAVHRFPFRSWLEGRLDQYRVAMTGVAALKARWQPDLIHMNAVGPSSLFHLRTTTTAAAPLLLTLQQQVLESQKQTADTLLSQALRAAQWVVGCSQSALSQSMQLAPDLAGRSSVIWNGVAPPALAPAPLSFRPPRLLCLGRLVPAKGFDVALDAFAAVAAHMPTLVLDIVGDGPERGALEAQASRLGIRDRVTWRGWVEPDQVYLHLNQATAVVMPSRREGLPLVAVQAAFMGRPVVASRAGGLPEVVQDGVTGSLVDHDDARGLAMAIRSLLDAPDQTARMGQAAHARALAEFSWQATVNAYDALYKRLGSRAEIGTLAGRENA